MRRRYFKRTHNRDKYSIEITNFRTEPITTWATIDGDGSIIATSYQSNYIIVPPVEMEGMRKVKHLTISIGNVYGGSAQSTNLPSGTLYYVLAYVPQGMDPLPIRTPIQGASCNMYVANQFVLSCGTLDFDAGPARISTKLSRNLNSGDRIMLVLASALQTSTEYQGTVKYAITLQ